MKLFKDGKLLLRAFTAVTEALLFYNAFLFINQMVGGTKINLVFFIMMALCGLFLNLLPYNSSDNRKGNLVFGYIGLAMATLAIVITAIIGGMNVFALPVGFSALLLIYWRAYGIYFVNISYVYTAKGFYKRMLLLFLLNGAAGFWSINYGVIAEELTRLSMLYIILALYNLSEVKNFRYVNKEENIRRTPFDITITSLMLIISVIMSIPKIFNIVMLPFAAAFRWIYGWIVKGFMLITYPIIKLFDFVTEIIKNRSLLGLRQDNLEEVVEQSEEIAEYMPPPIVELIGKVLAYIVMLLVFAFVVFLLFKIINRIMKTDKEVDFTEEREFILRTGKQRSPGIFNKLKETLKKATESISFILTADNRDKLRNEYKGFVQKIYNKKVIADYNNTAQEIFELMLSKLPEQKGLLSEVTGLYEEVRYGTKYPEDGELKSFKKNITEITRNLQQMQ